MKKNFVILILIILLFQNLALAVPSQSTNGFLLRLGSSIIPKGGGGNNGSGSGGSSSGSGLSGGAVTAITLGSIGGAALLGGLVWFLRPYFANGMTSGAALGLDNPILAMCLDEKNVKEITNKYQNAPLLNKALRQEKIKECPQAKYILIPDTEISANTFNTIMFEIPLDVQNSLGIVNVKIIQTTEPSKNSNISTEMLLGTNSNTQDTNKPEVHLQNTKIDKENGVIIKNGKINTTNLNTNSTGFLIISNKANLAQKNNEEVQKYAFVIEFSK